ncbi:MAG: hypothetical protein KC420_09080 [Myxococcales bacterium]|nr:hypothetical protein [Myxococcales bacterium]
MIRTERPVIVGANQRTFHGTIVAADEDPAHPDDDRQGIVVLRDQDSGDEHRLPIAAIRRANLVYEG